MLWWLSTAAVLAYVTFRAFVILRAKRGYRDMDNSALAPPCYPFDDTHPPPRQGP